jgi:phosphate transport system protein
MAKHLQREIADLKKQILALSALVEEAVSRAVRSITDRDVALAESIITQDAVVDRKEVEIEEECLKVLALHQPVAVDLRFIIAVLKMDNDLERIGDLAVNIAEQAIPLAERRAHDIPPDIPLMAAKVQVMLHTSVDALVSMDAALGSDRH